ncbi:MAG: DUF3768 domain-containing protein [Cytophagia bacterium]|nr:DUF3768 domain-containing protein [Cytophagia bacterium]
MLKDTSKIIADQNDLFRSKLGVLPQEIPLIKGKYLVTSGFCDLPSDEQISVLSGVRKFDEFTQDNDPHGEHDFGKFSVNSLDIIWKIDYYDTEYKYGSPDPSDPAKTRRVLTVMLACEY